MGGLQNFGVVKTGQKEEKKQKDGPPIAANKIDA
jgi:hypothetical protein